MSRRIPLLGLLIPIAAMGLAVSIAIDLDAVKVVFTSIPLRFMVKVLGLLFAATPGIVSYARAEHRPRQSIMAQSTKEAIADLEDLLVSAVAVLFDGEPAHRTGSPSMPREPNCHREIFAEDGSSQTNRYALRTTSYGFSASRSFQGSRGLANSSES